MASPKRKLIVGLVIHMLLLVTCLVTVTLMTLTKAFVQYYHNKTLADSSVSITDLNVQPDMPVAIHVLLLALGLFIPSVTGLFWTCNKRKSHKEKSRIVHIVFLIAGIVAVCVLLFSQAASLPENVNCRYDANSCYCGDNKSNVSNNVCACRDLRLSYFSILILGFITQLFSLGVVSKLIPLTCGSAKVSQDRSDATANHTAGVPPISQQQGPRPSSSHDDTN